MAFKASLTPKAKQAVIKERARKSREARLKKSKGKKGFFRKAFEQVSSDVKAAAKGSKEYQKAKAEKKAKKAKKVEGKVWKTAVARQKKAGGPSMNELIKQRNAAKKGSSEYAAAQNQINKSMGSRYRHKKAEGGLVESNPYGWPTKDSSDHS